MSLIADDDGDEVVRSRHGYSRRFTADLFWTWVIAGVLFSVLALNILQLGGQEAVIAGDDDLAPVSAVADRSVQPETAGRHASNGF